MADDAGKADQAAGHLGQLRLSPLSRSSSDPKTLARSGNGLAVSAYELMRLEDEQA